MLYLRACGAGMLNLPTAGQSVGHGQGYALGTGVWRWNVKLPNAGQLMSHSDYRCALCTCLWGMDAKQPNADQSIHY